eukprot:s2825_g7.t1
MLRSAQSSAPAVPPMLGTQVPSDSNGGGSTERLTIDSKWIPSAPLPEWKTWTSRVRELAGFKGWMERFASWLCLIHDAYADELKEALTLPYPVEMSNADQALRSRRLPEALHYREAALKYTVKKADKQLLLDVLREVGAEIESFHAMLEACLIYSQISDLRLNEGDQFLLYSRNLPDKVVEYAQVHCGPWIAEKGKGKGKSNDAEKECYNCGKKGHLAKNCRKSTTLQALWKDWTFGEGLLGEKSIKETQEHSSSSQGKSQAKSQSKGTWQGRSGKFREVEDGEEAAEEAEEEGQEPEGEQDGGDQVAMMVKSSGTVMSDSAGKAKKGTGTSSIHR